VRGCGSVLEPPLSPTSSLRQATAFHAVKNVGSGNAAELATYIVERGTPFLVVVE
jgi:hypothetical protein